MITDGILKYSWNESTLNRLIKLNPSVMSAQAGMTKLKSEHYVMFFPIFTPQDPYSPPRSYEIVKLPPDRSRYNCNDKRFNNKSSGEGAKYSEE